jgi:hypothetical protein
MIHDVAKKLNSVLKPEDLALLQKAFARVCELCGISQTSPPAQESAKVLINLSQSGIRNKFQLVAMLTGQRFRRETSYPFFGCLRLWNDRTGNRTTGQTVNN